MGIEDFEIQEKGERGCGRCDADGRFRSVEVELETQGRCWDVGKDVVNLKVGLEGPKGAAFFFCDFRILFSKRVLRLDLGFKPSGRV